MGTRGVSAMRTSRKRPAFSGGVSGCRCPHWWLLQSSRSTGPTFGGQIRSLCSSFRGAKLPSGCSASRSRFMCQTIAEGGFSSCSCFSNAALRLATVEDESAFLMIR